MVTPSQAAIPAHVLLHVGSYPDMQQFVETLEQTGP